MKKSVGLFLLAMELSFRTISLVNAQEVIKLKAAHYLPPTHPMSTRAGGLATR